jgi:hypothetical protein
MSWDTSSAYVQKRAASSISVNPSISATRRHSLHVVEQDAKAGTKERTHRQVRSASRQAVSLKHMTRDTRRHTQNTR